MRDAWFRRNLKINLPACSLRLFLLLRSIKAVALSKQKNRSFWDRPLLFGSGTQVNQVERIPEMMRRAYTFLRSGRAGPVMVQVPGDVAQEEISEEAVDFLDFKLSMKGCQHIKNTNQNAQ